VHSTGTPVLEGLKQDFVDMDRGASSLLYYCTSSCISRR